MNDFIVSVTGRNGVVVPDHFRDRIEEKLERATKYDPSITHVDIVLKAHRNPARASEDSKVEITATGAGHLSHAESSADNFFAALEESIEKLERTLHKVKTRRATPKSGHRAAKSTGEIARELLDRDKESANVEPADPYEDQVDFHIPGQVVREKEVNADPITVDDALSNMELLGHDFYLFIDVDTSKPSLVYRRHAYDYGIISIG